MDNTSYIALSRQLGLQRQMSVIANNMANMTTSGFKGQKMVFAEVLAQAGEPGRLSFVEDKGTVRDMAPGALSQTSNPFDFAIDGEGLFAVQTPNGPRYTRNGHFRLSDTGQITTSGGYPLLDEGGGTITLPGNVRSVQVARDGTVSTPEGVIARLRPVVFENPQALEPEGQSLFKADAPPLPAEGSNIVQGSVEGANIQPIMEMTRMMETVRAFQNTQRLLETQHDLTRRTVEANLSQQA